MKRMGQFFLAAVIGVGLVWAPVASAGTKYATNIVPTSLVPPNLAKKSQVKVRDNGRVTVVLKGVQDSGGRVTTDGSWKGLEPTLTGDEYFVILKATFIADGTNFEVSVPVELKNGNGASTVSVAALFALVPDGVVKSVEARGADVYGPLGVSNATGCQTAIFTSGGIVLEPDDDTNPNPCKAGTRVGAAGILVK